MDRFSKLLLALRRFFAATFWISIIGAFLCPLVGLLFWFVLPEGFVLVGMIILGGLAFGSVCALFGLMLLVAFIRDLRAGARIDRLA